MQRNTELETQYDCGKGEQMNTKKKRVQKQKGTPLGLPFLLKEIFFNYSILPFDLQEMCLKQQKPDLLLPIQT